MSCRRFVAPSPVKQEANNCARGCACFPSPHRPRPPSPPSLGSIQARPPNRHCSTPMYVAPSSSAAGLSGAAVSAAVLSGSVVAAWWLVAAPASDSILSRPARERTHASSERVKSRGRHGSFPHYAHRRPSFTGDRSDARGHGAAHAALPPGWLGAGCACWCAPDGFAARKRRGGTQGAATPEGARGRGPPPAWGSLMGLLRPHRAVAPAPRAPTDARGDHARPPSRILRLFSGQTRPNRHSRA